MNRQTYIIHAHGMGYAVVPCGTCGRMMEGREDCITTWLPGVPGSREWHHARCYDEPPEGSCRFCGAPAGSCDKEDGSCLL